MMLAKPAAPDQRTQGESPIDDLVDRLFDTRRIPDEAQRLTAVHELINRLGQLPRSQVHNLPPARLAVIARSIGYDTMLFRDGGLCVWIPRPPPKGPGEWIDFFTWFYGLPENYERSATA